MFLFPNYPVGVTPDMQKWLTFAFAIATQGLEILRIRL